MANKLSELNRGRMEGLDMAKRLLLSEGDRIGAAIVGEEIKKRGGSPIANMLLTKELKKGTEDVRLCLYESMLCQALMVLHDGFGFGTKRCRRFIERWNYKTECMEDGLVDWKDQIAAVAEDLKIYLPTEHMKKSRLL